MSVDQNYIKLAQLHKIIKNYSYSEQQTFKEILKSGFDINYGVPENSLFSKRKPEFTGYTLLHFAVEYKVKEVLYLILNNPVLYNPFTIQITCKALNGFTPLRLAFEGMKDFVMTKDLSNNKLFMILNKLLSAHIKLDIKINPKCQNNISHFHIACMVDDKIANFFIEAGVDVNETVDVESPIFPGFTPLHFAIRYSHPELVRKLLQCDVNAIQPDGNFKTPLRLLVDFIMQTNDMLREQAKHNKDKLKLKEERLTKSDQIMEMLMGATEFGCSNPVDDIGFTFLHASCTRQRQDYVEKLLKSGVNINEQVKFEAPMWPGYTPLHFAARCNFEILMLLLRNGANLSVKDANGMTALDLCTERYEPSEISRILKMEPMASVRFENSASLADVFSAMDSHSSFEKLVSTIEVDARVSLDSPIWPGYTMLHLLVLRINVKKKYICKYFVLKNRSWNHYTFSRSSYYNLPLLRLPFTKYCSMLFCDAKGMTPLRLAFLFRKGEEFCSDMSGDAEKISLTLGQENIVHLYEVVAANCPKIIERLFKNGLDPNWTLQKDEIWYSQYDSDKVITLKAGLSLLHIAALVEANVVINELSKIDVDISALDADGLTPAQLGFLHSKHKGTLSNLLSIPRAQRSNDATRSNLTHLHIACYAGNVEAAKKLLENTPNINQQIVCDPLDPYAQVLDKYNGYTPLHFAVQFEQLKVVSLLVQRNADVLIKNVKGLNPLHLVLQNSKARKSHITRHVINKAIQANNFQDDFGITRLHLAYFIQHKDIYKLIQAGENMNGQINLDSPVCPGDTPHHLLAKRFSEDSTVPDILSQDGFDLTLQNADNLTSLLLLHSDQLPFNQRINLTRLITRQDINKFCSSNQSSNEGLSHLHIVCHLNQLTYAEKFLQSGADINAPIDHFNNFWAGRTPLHIAAQTRNCQLIALLLQYGANVLAEDTNGLTAMHYIIQNSLSLAHIQSIDDMLSRSPTKFDVYKPNAFGKSVFLSLLEYHNDSIDCLRWILDKYDGHIDVLNPPFDNLIKLLGRKPRSDIIPLLVEKGVDLSAQDSKGCNALFIVISLLKSLYTSPLHFEWGFNNVETLINAGCELDHRDRDGKTALHQAVISSSTLGVSVLLALGADINICDNRGIAPSQRLVIKSSIGQLFQEYAYKMACAGLYLDPLNQKFLKCFAVDELSASKTQILLALSQMEKECAHEELSVRDLLTEWVILGFPKLREVKRRAILELLRDNELAKRYPGWQGLFRLQRRRMLTRFDLFKTAAISCQTITGLPQVCADMIAEHLSNKELKKLINI